MKRLPEETDEEFSQRKDKYLFPLIQVSVMVAACHVQLENCDKALHDKYGLDWGEAWGEVFNSLKHILLKLDTAHEEVMELEERK
jgi:hypothetical protein